MTILDECRGLITSLCAVHRGNLDVDCEDIEQDIRINLWQSYESFRGESSIKTWAYRVALNTIYMHYRRQRYRPNAEARPPESMTTIADKRDNELTEQLYRLIERLEAEDRTIITMYLEPLSQKEMSAVLGISEDTVNRRIKKIKQRLKELNDHDNGDR